ncbi:hypothetical protein [Saccharomonospora azurea]|uniref:hypothetical protein n=1 Tax=Saccharomonospora azurea TaxID=40988 RepID=UPI001E330467|nr:hypothetical protein [Saccharomonospora azurea]
MNATVVKEDVLSVDVEVRGVVGLADYVAHLKRIPGRCGIAGSGSGALALAFAVERTWRYATAMVGRAGCASRWRPTRRTAPPPSRRPAASCRSTWTPAGFLP